MRRYASFLAVAEHFPPVEPAPAILPTHGIFGNRTGADRPYRVEHVNLLVSYLIGIERHHRFHGHQTEELHQVILYHVAEGPRVLVIASPMPNAGFFGHRDCHVIDIATVPDRLEEGVSESKCQDVLHRLLAQIMVDAEDLRFVKTLPQRARHFPR